MSWETFFQNNPEALSKGLAQQPEFQKAIWNSPGAAGQIAARQTRQAEQQAALRDQRTSVAAWADQDPNAFWNQVARQSPEVIAQNINPYQAADSWNQFYDSKSWQDPEQSHWKDVYRNPLFTQALTDSIQKGNRGSDVDQWFWGVHNLFYDNPTAFKEWSDNNPEMAIRFHALAGAGRETSNDNWGGYDWNNKAHRQYANALAYQRSQDLGYGEDGKHNGRVVVGDFDTVEDVKNDKGWGDVDKIGTPQKLTDGLGNFLEEHPWESLAAVVSAVGAPYATAGLSGLLGTTGAAVASGAGAGALTQGALASATGGDIWDAVLEGGLGGALTAGVGSLLSSGAMSALEGLLTPEEMAKFTAATQAGTEAAEVGGNVPWSTIARGAVQGGIEVGHASRDSGYQPETNSAMHDAIINNGPKDGQTFDEWLQDVWHTIPEGPVTTGGSEGTVEAGSGGSTAPAPGEMIEPNHGPRDDEIWRHTNPDGTVVAGNEYGEVWEVGETDTGEGDESESGVYIPNVGGSGSSSAGAGGVHGGAGDTGSGTGAGSGSGAGDGTGAGEGSGEGDGTGEGSEIPWEVLLPALGLLPLIGNDGDLEYRKPGRYGQARYQPPTFPDMPEQRTLPETNSGQLPQQELQAPMVLPANNSGQDSFEDWLRRYLREREAASGLLASSGGGLL